MVAARETKKQVYVSDILGTSFIRRVDDHFFTQGQLGWVDPAGGEFPIPSGTRPRHVVGVDPSGRRHSVVVASTIADLWTRVATTWDILADDGALVTVTMTGQVGEAVTF